MWTRFDTQEPDNTIWLATIKMDFKMEFLQVIGSSSIVGKSEFQSGEGEKGLFWVDTRLLHRDQLPLIEEKRYPGIGIVMLHRSGWTAIRQRRSLIACSETLSQRIEVYSVDMPINVALFAVRWCLWFGCQVLRAWLVPASIVRRTACLIGWSRTAKASKPRFMDSSCLRRRNRCCNNRNRLTCKY